MREYKNQKEFYGCRSYVERTTGESRDALAVEVLVPISLEQAQDAVAFSGNEHLTAYVGSSELGHIITAAAKLLIKGAPSVDAAIVDYVTNGPWDT
ncbi:hypothetical protein H7171_02040 [Candidatus Saccharibacteria bacterium]|nr:hypothetical protein [Candidatus Saccharibacteria bacterium]